MGRNVLAEELARYYEMVEPYDFYREIFGDGELDEADAFTEGKYCAIALEITNKKVPDKKRPGREKTVVYRHTVTDELDVVDLLQNSEHFCVMAPISYVGKSRRSANARMMYALGVEIDNLVVKKYPDGRIQQLGLENLIDKYAEQAHWIPKPTYIVASGNGLHLYYQFERPLVLFPNTIDSLRRHKEQLTKMLWSKSVTRTYTDDTIQQESIFQGFRMPGTLTRHGDKAVAFRVGDKVSIDYMNSFMYSSLKGSCDIEGTYKSKLLLKDAKEKYPEWYQKVIVEGDHTRKEWALSRAVYDWWLRKIKEEAVDGHRFHCIMMLAIYAIKCSNYHEKKNPDPVTQEEFEADAWSLLDDFNQRGKRADNPFTEHDVLCAIQVYEDRDYITYPKNSIAYKSGIAIVPSVPRRERGKRLKRDVHLKRARAVQAVDYPDGEWRNKAGRPSAEQAVREYRETNPTARKADCIRDTGLSKPTVYKWWSGDPISTKKAVKPAVEQKVEKDPEISRELIQALYEMSDEERERLFRYVQQVDIEDEDE